MAENKSKKSAPGSASGGSSSSCNDSGRNASGRNASGRNTSGHNISGNGASGNGQGAVSPEVSSGLQHPSLYINRELSLLEFNHRVLSMARDRRVPLLERLRYLCISGNNLDEFFEIRVAGLQKQRDGDGRGTGPDQLGPSEQLHQIDAVAHQLVKLQYAVLNDELLPALADQKIVFPKVSDWSKKMRGWASRFFDTELFPVLSPMGLDPSHPFPQLTNKSLNFIVSLRGTDAFGREASRAVVRAPRSLPRIIPVPMEISDGQSQFVLLSTMIERNMGRLFPGLETKGVYQFRVTRNSDLYLADDDVADLRLALRDELNARDYGNAVRLEVGDDCPASVIRFLLNEFKLEQADLYVCNGPVNLSRLSKLPDMLDRPDLNYSNFTPVITKTTVAGKKLFSALKKRDVLLHYPYQSSHTVVSFLQSAARDPKVLAIKQTLYRTGEDSAYVDALIEAAHNGKDVTVVIELRARFDEDTNLKIASRLQRAGVQVVYGVVGFKSHAKIMLVIRREKSKMMRYAHIGTGNYHEGNTRLYTDLGLLTHNKQITGDIQKIFNQLTGLGKVANVKLILHSPFNMHRKVLKMIQKQTEKARQGKPALIRARMNSLNEPQIIEALYQASNAGVKVRLLVRGICALRPGVTGVSENIRVVSVIGRFLEHSRVYAFGAENEEEVFVSSADWMPRNMFHRVEVAVPILDGKLRSKVLEESIDSYFRDNSFAWELLADGSYKRVVSVNGAEAFSSQSHLQASYCTVSL